MNFNNKDDDRLVLLTRTEQRNNVIAMQLNNVWQLNTGISSISVPLGKYIIQDKVLQDVIYEFEHNFSAYRTVSHCPELVITSKFVAELLSDEWPIELGHKRITESDDVSDDELAEASKVYRVGCHVVGTNSAKTLISSGKFNILNVQNSIESLVNVLNMTVCDNKLIYLSGDIITKEILLDNIIRKIVYNIQYISELPLEVIEKIVLGKIKYVMFFSSEAVKVFIDLMYKHGIYRYVYSMTIICISSKVASAIRDSKVHSMYPTTPNLNDMIKIIISLERAE
jgi:uroporphyrinogen-III synthase